MDQNTKAKKPKFKLSGIERSLLTAVVLLFATIGIFISGTYAYFVSDSSSDNNKIVSGNLDVRIIELQDAGEEGDIEITPMNVYPGTSVKQRKLVFKNSGNIPVYIRIKVEFELIESEIPLSRDLSELISCNFMLGNEDAWEYLDGYYYYTAEIAPGTTTVSLFDTVIFSPMMGNEYKNSKIQFKVICQSVQSVGNSEDPLTAWGWPAEINND